MSVELVFKESSNDFKNYYVVEFTFTHGDSDFTTNSIELFNIDEKENVIRLVKTLNSINTEIKDREDIRSLINQYSDQEFDGEDFSDILNDFWAGDRVYTDCKALMSFELFFYDDKGNKFDVKIKE